MQGQCINTGIALLLSPSMLFTKGKLLLSNGKCSIYDNKCGYTLSVSQPTNNQDVLHLWVLAHSLRNTGLEKSTPLTETSLEKNCMDCNRLTTF